MPLDAQSIIQTFGMTPHPEGGWYKETYQTPVEPGKRSAVSAIYFLLQPGERSHWHTVDACEIWLWHMGSPILLHISADGRETTTLRLGSNLAAGEQPQAIVPTGAWQSAESVDGWALVSCVVAPAFDFAGFTIAPAGWSPQYPSK